MEVSRSPERKKAKERSDSFLRTLGNFTLKLVGGFVDLLVPGPRKPER